MAIVPDGFKQTMDDVRKKADEIRASLDKFAPFLEPLPVVGAYVTTALTVVDTLDSILDLADDAVDRL